MQMGVDYTWQVLISNYRQYKKVWNDTMVSDVQYLNITRAYRDVQNKPAWQDTTYATHT